MRHYYLTVAPLRGSARSYTVPVWKDCRCGIWTVTSKTLPHLVLPTTSATASGRPSSLFIFLFMDDILFICKISISSGATCLLTTHFTVYNIVSGANSGNGGAAAPRRRPDAAGDRHIVVRTVNCNINAIFPLKFTPFKWQFLHYLCTFNRRFKKRASICIAIRYIPVALLLYMDRAHGIVYVCSQMGTIRTASRRL